MTNVTIAVFPWQLGVFSTDLAVASRKLAVESDPRIDEIEGLLPGANCGACGFPGCRGLAEAIVGGSAPVNACPVTRDCGAIAEVMGVEALACERRVAKVRCIGGKKEAQERFAYVGSKDCYAAHQLAGGPKACEYGCLGLGSCVQPAVLSSLMRTALPWWTKCTGCGQCVTAPHLMPCFRLASRSFMEQDRVCR